MAFSPFRTLRLEQLETRDAPTSLLGTVTAPTAPISSASYLLDTTLYPSDPNATTVSALIVAIGGPTSGGGFNLTVSGLSSSHLQPGASLQVAVGTSIYAVTNYAVNTGGTVTLTLVNAPGLADALASATTVSVIIGNGTTTTTNPPPIDPTLIPSG